MHRVKTLYYKVAMALTAVWLLGACSGEELPQTGEDALSALQTGDVAVGFNLSTQAMTTKVGAAGEMSDALLKTEGAGVFAYYTGATQWTAVETTAKPNFMYNQYIYYEGASGSWFYEPVKYWPNDFSEGAVDNNGATGSENGGKVSFFAYAPYSGNTVNLNDVTYTFEPSSGRFKRATDTYYDEQTGASGIVAMSSNSRAGDPSVTYVLDDVAAKQVDLLWGTRGKAAYNQAVGTETVSDATLNTDLVKQKTTEKVDFLFKHALASIDIYVMRVYNETTPPSPTPLAPDAADNTRIFVSELKLAVASMYTRGTLNLATGAWTGGTPIAKTITINNSRIRAALAGTTAENSSLAEVQGYELNSFASHAGVTATLTRLTNETYATMLIPVADNPGISVTPSITYSFVTEDDAEEHGLPNSTGTHKYVRVLNKNITAAAPVNIGTRSVSPGAYSYTLEPGKRYVLVCYIGVESVEFELTGVEDWDFPIRMHTGVTDFSGSYNESTGVGGTGHTVSER